MIVDEGGWRQRMCPSRLALPLGLAYATWVGIGTLGAVAVGIVAFQESVSVLKVTSLLLITVGIIGLKLSGSG